MGPTEGFGPTALELEAIWPVVRDQVMEARDNPGRRPWAWWRFDLGEDKYPDGRYVNRQGEAVRLARLGVLESWELAEFKKTADDARPRIGTDREQTGGSIDVQAVELWDAVQQALQRRART
jgi:hypothetical protein